MLSPGRPLAYFNDRARASPPCYDERKFGSEKERAMEVKVYGADWCGDTQKTLAHLRRLGVAHRYINVEEDAEASAWVKEHNEGKERKPTLDIAGQVLTTPTDRELDSALREKGLMA
jgi:glutaredoxin